MNTEENVKFEETNTLNQNNITNPNEVNENSYNEVVNSDGFINQEIQYVDEYGNPINTIATEEVNNNSTKDSVNELSIASQLNATISENIMDAPEASIPTNGLNEIVESSPQAESKKEMLTGMVTFDYNNVPITDIVNSIILDAINKGASDIHFDPFDEGIKIRVRVDGDLNDYSIVPLFVKKNMITRIKIISGMNITESRTPQDGAIRTELQNKTIDLRVSCLPTNLGEKIVIRIMDYSMSASGIEKLDFNERNLEKVNKMISLPNGIILVTGATGTGKSTTVYSMLQKLNTEQRNIVTVEDPIEMNIGGINQVQAQAEIGLDFATVLRSILRQDPDVIMIGEIRDDETARIAVRASITGHLVLSTIHTNNSLNTIERLTDMSVERYLLGSSLAGIISQKLSRRLCEKCKEKRKTTDYEKELFKKSLNKDVEEIYAPVGCSECNHGYHGRIAIHEVLLLNQEISDAITTGVDKSILRKLVYGENGTETMLQDGLNKVIEGKTSFDEILKLIDLEDDLGTGSQLGIKEQIDSSKKDTNGEEIEDTKNNQSQAVNLNITPEILSALSLMNNNAQKLNSTSPSLQKLSILLEELWEMKNIIGKRKFTLQIMSALNEIENITTNIKELNDLFNFDEEIKNNAIDLIQAIDEAKANTHNRRQSETYDKIIERIKEVFDLVDADFLPKVKGYKEIEDNVLNFLQEIDEKQINGNYEEIIPINITNKKINFIEDNSMEESFDDNLNEEIIPFNTQEQKINIVEEVPTISNESLNTELPPIDTSIVSSLLNDLN